MVNLRNDDIHIVHHSYTKTDSSKQDDSTTKERSEDDSLTTKNRSEDGSLTTKNRSEDDSLTKTDSSMHDNSTKKDNPENDSSTKKDIPEDDSLTKEDRPEDDSLTKEDRPEDDSSTKKDRSEDDSSTKKDRPEDDSLTKEDRPEDDSSTKKDRSEDDSSTKKDRSEDDNSTKKDSPEDDSSTKKDISEDESLTKKDISKADSLTKEDSPEDDSLKCAYTKACEFLKGGSKSKKYNLFLNNCEHFCNKCHASIDKSMQVCKLINFICNLASGSTHISTHCGKLIHHVWNFLSKQRPIFKDLFKHAHLTYSLIALLAILLNFFYTLFLTYGYTKERKNHSICDSCFWRKIVAIWISFFMSSAVSAGVFLLLFFVVCPHGWPKWVFILVLVATGVMGIGVSYGLSKAYKTYVPSKVPVMCKQVSSFESLKKGDVISIKRFLQRRSYMIVAEKPNSSVVMCIFYEGLIKQEYKEEKVTLDFTKQNVRLHTYDGIDTYDENEVVKRARFMIDDFVIALRSQTDEFCDWAKRKGPSLNSPTDQMKIEFKGMVNQLPFEQNDVVGVNQTRATATTFLPPTRVRIFDDLHDGRSIIKLKDGDWLVISKTEGRQPTEPKVKCYSIKHGIKEKTLHLKKFVLFSKIVHPALSDYPERICIRAVELTNPLRFKTLLDLICDKTDCIYAGCPKGTILSNKSEPGIYYVSCEIIGQGRDSVQMYKLSEKEKKARCELKEVCVNMDTMVIHRNRDSVLVYPPEIVLKRVERLESHSPWNLDLETTISWLYDVQVPSYFNVNTTDYKMMPYFRTSKKFQLDISSALPSPKSAEDLKAGMIISFRNHLSRHLGILVHSICVDNNTVQITVLYKSNKPFRGLQERTMCRKLDNVQYVPFGYSEYEKTDKSVREYRKNAETNGNSKLSEKELCCNFANGTASSFLSLDLSSWNVHSVLDIPCESIICCMEERRVGIVKKIFDNEKLKAKCICEENFELDLTTLKTTKTLEMCIVDPEQTGNPDDRNHLTKIELVLKAMHKKHFGEKCVCEEKT
ncbi:uncharacterized protein LOC128238110 [Mya arenaria]|uniref:uncharacterized protein LOC128238110 n=1 Tax=Mya arenaria TaxID=6604 RepID=UPI0022E1E450|nr:uncharacterized protein LOC128238110 [Mya arenaria]